MSRFKVSKGLFRSGMIVSCMTMISRILGLVRDAVVANLLGASAAADVFYLLTVFLIFYAVYLQKVPSHKHSYLC
ncbi:putative MviN protein [Pseudoalteromonas distincta]|nr:putative MviN protein [Pseudoalteromonas distincta]